MPAPSMMASWMAATMRPPPLGVLWIPGLSRRPGNRNGGIDGAPQGQHQRDAPEVVLLHGQQAKG